MVPSRHLNFISKGDLKNVCCRHKLDDSFLHMLNQTLAWIKWGSESQWYYHMRRSYQAECFWVQVTEQSPLKLVSVRECAKISRSLEFHLVPHHFYGRRTFIPVFAKAMKPKENFCFYEMVTASLVYSTSAYKRLHRNALLLVHRGHPCFTW